ncbi:hypothetical protein HY605_05830 [Candidatus Peregrinibacteria bacterium]|nr:hypothetical protein [Candidatus Peregrinibacteria bacterium]
MRKIKVDWDAVHRSNFESKAFWDIYWVRSARSLIVSAKEIEPKVMELWENYRAHRKDKSIRLKANYCQGPYYMLIAFAVENFFKAAMVRKNSYAFKQAFKLDNKFPKELLSHDLVKLANKAHFDFTLKEEDLLRRLTRHAIWAGRYPVPVDYKKSAGGEKFSDGQEYSVIWLGGSDVERLNALLESIEKRLGFSHA